jgi:hypothetical protein
LFNFNQSDDSEDPEEEDSVAEEEESSTGIVHEDWGTPLRESERRG